MKLGKCRSCGSQVDLDQEICDYCGQPPVELKAVNQPKPRPSPAEKPTSNNKNPQTNSKPQDESKSADGLKLKIRSLGSAVVIDIIGSLTEKNVSALTNEVGEIFLVHDQKSFIINLRGLTELSHHALAALIHLRQFLKSEGGRLSLLAGAKPVISTLSSISSLAGIQIFTDENAARRYFYRS